MQAHGGANIEFQGFDRMSKTTGFMRFNRYLPGYLLAFVAGFALMPLQLSAAEAGGEAGEETAEESAATTEDQEDVKALDRVRVKGRMTRYSALKSDTPIMETARSVSIETAEDYLDMGALELSDTYLYSAGVFGETYGFATRGDWVKVRGLDVPDYRDSLQALFGFYNNSRPHIYTLEQVEILKGPASVLYGQGSPGGLVNIVSKRPQEDLRQEVVMQAGNYNYLQLAADVGGKINESGSLLYRVTAVARDAGTQVDYVNNDTQVLAPSISWLPSAATTITLLGNYQDAKGKTGAQFLPIRGTLVPAANGEFIEPETFLGEPSFDRYNTETKSLTLLAEHMFNATWSMEATARWTDGLADYQQAWPSFIGGDRYVYNNDGTLYENGTVPRTWYDSYATSEQLASDVRFRAEFHSGSFKHELMLGLQYQDVTTENDSAYAYALGYDFVTGGPDATYGDQFWINLFDPTYGSVPSQAILDNFYSDGPESNTIDRGVYINDLVTWNNWHFTAGIRYDDVTTDTGFAEQDDDALSTSAGVLYLFDNGIAPYVSYAESFEPVVGVDSVTQQPFKPQEGRQYEIGVKYQPVGNGSWVTLGLFDIEQSNLPNPAGLPGAPSQQEGVAEINGIELESQLNLAQGMALEFNASRLDTENPNGTNFASVPENQASAWLDYRMPNGFRSGLGLRYVGKSYDGSDDIVTPSYTLVDFMLGYRFDDNWDLRLNVRNATDKEYIATCLDRQDCFYGEQRTIMGTVAYRFGRD